MFQTLHQILCRRDNDYSQLEVEYSRQTGTPLVNDPYQSVLHPLSDISLSASVVIFAWNAAASLERCLLALEQSSFNQKYPDQLEIVVVDDGSEDTTWQILERIDLDLHIKAIHQDHHGRSQAQNTAIALSEGDVIICCDAQVILSTFAIEEMMKRHQLLDPVLLLGFCTPLASDHVDIQPAALPAYLQASLPPFSSDRRMGYSAGGWSLCCETHHLKHLGRDKRICTPRGLWLDLPSQVFGFLFSLRRDDFLNMHGYDEGFQGWGSEQMLISACALAQGNYLIPVYAASGWYLPPGERRFVPPFLNDRLDPKGWQEFVQNQIYYTQRLHDPLHSGDHCWLKRARERVLKFLEHHPSRVHPRGEMDRSYYQCYERAHTDLSTFGRYHFQLGRYKEAAHLFLEAGGTEGEAIEATRMRGKALRLAGCIAEAIAVLKNFTSALPLTLRRDNAYIFASAFIDYALALAAQGRFVEARQQLRRANEVQPDNLMLHSLLKKPAGFHAEVVRIYTRQQNYTLGLRACEAALILDPHNLLLQVQRSNLLDLLSKQETAQEALNTALSNVPLPDHPANRALLVQTWEHLAANNLEQAKLELEQLQQIHSDSSFVTRNLQALHTTAMHVRRLPLTSAIIHNVQHIPGALGCEEMAFLIALTLQTVNAQPNQGASVFIDVNRYCGQSTLAMGLTLRSMRCHHGRVLSVHQQGREPVQFDGVSQANSYQLFQQALWEHELSEQVICLPEQRALFQKQLCHLLLVDIASNESGLPKDLAEYLEALVPGGLVLAYPYAHTHPEMQSWVNALLGTAHYTFIGQVGQLIALQAPAAPEE